MWPSQSVTCNVSLLAYGSGDFHILYVESGNKLQQTKMCRKCIDLNLICFAVTGENLLIHTRVVWELDIASEKMQN